MNFNLFQDNSSNSEVNFVYDDSDTHANEIAELYSYTEQYELQLNVKVKFFQLH